MGGACDVKSQDEESQGISVTITHVENDNKVWVTSQQEELDLLMEELASLVLEPAYHVNIEDTVAIIFSEDGVLYRGRLMDLDEVFMRMNNAGEAELSLGSSKVSFDITGVVAQSTEEGVCVKDQPQPQSDDSDRQDLKTIAAHRNETAN